MMSLFSPFNPIPTSMMPMNWSMIMIPSLLFINQFWSINSLLMNLKFSPMKKMINQFKSTIKTMNNPDLIMIMMIFLMIMYFNMLGLMPESFSITSHIMINLIMALTLWMGIMSNKMYNLKKFLSHLTPSNTPMPIIPFMVVVEYISLSIQPLTLSIRLTANVTAGHIMIILVSNLYKIIFMPTMMINIMLMTLELGVSIIQAYVFSMLLIMYIK